MASKKSRTPKRRAWKRLSITEPLGSGGVEQALSAREATMPVSPSSALQIVINNPGKLESFYSLDKGKILGKGSFGVVKRAYVSATMAQRAVKFIAIERMKEKLNVLKQEIEIMKMVDHPNIIMLYEIFEDQQYLCLVMELCSGGSLLSRLKFSGHFSEEHTAMAMRQILRAVFYLHRNWICHRDLKAENVLVSTGEVLDKTLLKVSDFGLSCPFRPKQVLTEKVGTLILGMILVYSSDM
ncbi:Calcium-dependent protein kinase 2 (PfCDPK2) [Durusdinium trenchii]|uniref:Calcium-dependent protein kinase 2 (PfCDPK2) n=1 Tax=Durusdinium trenchii TaxID=1381693 RepID=A0ABP0N9E1_9DINO